MQALQLKRIARHVFFWFSILLFFALLDYLMGNTALKNSFLSNLLFLPQDLALSYLIIYFLVPKLFLKRKYAWFFLSILGILTLNVLLSKVIEILTVNLPFVEIEEKKFPRFVLSSVTTFTFIATIATTLKLVDINNHRLLLKERAEARLHKTELDLLRSQVNPHFLFNTLNNINTLVFKDQERTYNSIIKLSEIMRYMHDDQRNEYVPIEKELEYILNYVELQKLRFSEENIIAFHSSIHDKNLAVAPMIFICFVENAFKHCNKKDILPAIRISIRTDEDGISLSVKNYYSKQLTLSSKEGGFGLKNIKQRLDLIYKNNYLLNIDDRNDEYKVELKLGFLNEGSY
jgi:two-component system, LytTR family, sensor kinase